MQVLILGLNHQIQPRRIESSGSDGKPQVFEQHQKQGYERLVRELLSSRGIQYVGEEARHRDESIAALVCQEEGCSYGNIEMTEEQRERRNIPPGYAENGQVSDNEIARGNREREEYMADQAIAGANDANADSILVICGRMHLDALAERFRLAGHTVERDDLMNHNWYVEDWAEHMWYNL